MSMLMTNQEEQQSPVRDDGVFFQKGLPAVVSAIVRNTWAEPYMLAHRLFGERAEQALEPFARAVGHTIGILSKPAFAAFRSPDDHPLEDTLKATRIAENATGIYGRDYYVTPKKVVRRIHTCPYRDREGARILCHVGEAAGQEIFAELVPGIRHKVHVTMARGHAFCEYSYEVD
ncbi:MAG: hypothetical protein U1F40_04795 [Turneriella sp.]|nr:hypothetical protein [Turneriella sp.]HNL53881.1 hypothetical protein [Turneriella sp.]